MYYYEFKVNNRSKIYKSDTLYTEDEMKQLIENCEDDLIKSGNLNYYWIEVLNRLSTLYGIIPVSKPKSEFTIVLQDEGEVVLN